MSRLAWNCETQSDAQAMDDALALFNALPESDRSLLLAGNSKISTTNLKLTNVPAAVPPPVATTEPKPSQPPSQPQPTMSNSALPSTPSTSQKKKPVETEAEGENKQQPEDTDSPAKKAPGRPKKPVDPEKAAKART